MNNLIVWSGGFDSTYMIYDLLKKGEIIDECNLVSIINTACGEEKIFRENKARLELYKALKEEFPKIEFIWHEIQTVIKVSKPINVQEQGLAQPILWVSNLLPYIESNSKIYFGYIYGDGAIGYMQFNQDIIDLFSKYRTLNNVTIEYPLRFVKKREIIHMLFKHKDSNKFFKAMLDNCTTCENFEIEDWCGKCETCDNFISACFDLIIHNREDTELKEEVKKYLKDKFGKEITIHIDTSNELLIDKRREMEND